MSQTGEPITIGGIFRDALYTFVEKEKADYLREDESDDGQILIDQAVLNADRADLERQNAINQRNLALVGVAALLTVGLTVSILRG